MESHWLDLYVVLIQLWICVYLIAIIYFALIYDLQMCLKSAQACLGECVTTQ